jgi:hypothetical protein
LEGERGFAAGADELLGDAGFPGLMNCWGMLDWKTDNRQSIVTTLYIIHVLS